MLAQRSLAVARRAAWNAPRPAALGAWGLHPVQREEDQRMSMPLGRRHVSQLACSPETLETLARIPLHIGDVQAAGLGSFATPVGLIQNLVEFNTVMLDAPWAVGICATTILMRTLMLPLVFGSMRNNTILMNIQPQLQLHSQRIRECQTRNDHDGAAQAAANLNGLFKEHGVHPLKGLLPLFVQAPVFISFFMALRQMANLPIESMKTGGLLWFTDLTAADPYYVLPVIASATMLATIEFGSEGVKQNNVMMKNVFRGLSIVLLPVTINLPTAIFVYWCTANMFSLSQMLMLKIPGLKKSLGIPEQIQHPTPAGSQQGGSPKGFMDEVVSGFKAAAGKQGNSAPETVSVPPPSSNSTMTASPKAARTPRSKRAGRR